MSTKGLFRIFTPKQKVFYDLPEAMTNNLVMMAGQLKLITEDNDETGHSVSVEAINRLEQENNDLARNVFTELSSNFITPFDREDIYHLAGALRDVTSYIFSCNNKIQKYSFVKSISGYNQMAQLVLDSCTQLHLAVSGLRNYHYHTPITAAIYRIKQLEREADDKYYDQVEQLFKDSLSTNDLIKATEIYQIFEVITDKCYEASKRIKGILVKAA
jgi:uncharacterized protein